MPVWLVSFLLKYLAPVLVEMFMAFIANLKAARVDDPTIIDVIEKIVSGVAVAHPEWTGDQKYDYAFEASKTYFKDLGKDVRDSLINTLIELAVQKVKAVETK